jgi:glycosyltransferase involved in cell wall biosynthesis
MIDIIIPAYNSHKTIIKTLASIAMQLNKDEIKTTIVNDGGKDYKEIVNTFSKIMNIQEIGYKENKGVGYARQYGIDHTSEEFIAFIDSDDTFRGATSLSMLAKVLNNTNSKFVISSFVQMGKEAGQQAPVSPNLVWLFGHMYRRNFLKEHNIRFTSTGSNEDVGFNSQCSLIARHEMGDEGGKVLNVPTYEWHYNESSITRKGNNDYEYGICTPGYIYNLHNSYKVAQREGVTIKEMANGILETAFSCFIYYNVALAKGVSEDVLKVIEDLSRAFYYDYYKQAQPFISEDEYKNIYSASMKAKQQHTQGVIFKITLEDFVNLMFSKEKPEIDYNELEKKIQLKIEK